MMKWWPQMEGIVVDAAGKAGLPRRIAAFDGDAWVWVWRRDSKPGRTAEASVRVRPDTLDEGVHIEVLSAAWLEGRRSVATNRALWGQFFTVTNINQDADALTKILSDHLRKAWDTASALDNRLEDVSRSREQVMGDLQKRGLLG